MDSRGSINLTRFGSVGRLKKTVLENKRKICFSFYGELLRDEELSRKSYLNSNLGIQNYQRIVKIANDVLHFMANFKLRTGCGQVTD
jgi:hypothetical protein